jgi:peptidoglycan/LPS O-acetylase OafA/YrhL
VFTLRPVTGAVPPVVRGTGVLVLLEGLAAFIFAVALVIGGIRGADAKIAYGTAGWFVLAGAAVSAAGWALWRGRRWGRGVAVFVQLLLLGVAWYMLSGSHRPEFGVPLGVIALVALALLFSGPALKWAASQSDSASSDNAGPDTR